MVSFVSEKYDFLRSRRSISSLRCQEGKTEIISSSNLLAGRLLAWRRRFLNEKRHLRPILIARYRVYNVGNYIATVSPWTRGRRHFGPDSRFW